LIRPIQVKPGENGKTAWRPKMRVGRRLDGGLGVLVLGGGTSHLAKLVLLGELAAEGSEIADQFVAGLNHSILGGNRAIGLDAKDELVLKGMRDLYMDQHWNLTQRKSETRTVVRIYLVSGEQDTRAAEKAVADQVAQGVVLLEKGEDGGRWDT
jgi:hypothetical protein